MKLRSIIAGSLALVLSATLALAQVTPGTSPLSIAKGGTSASTASGAKSALGLTLSVKDYGATGNCVTDDTTAIQTATNAAIAAGGGVVYFPAATCYKTTTQLLIDLSSYSTRYQNRVIFRGDGPGPSVIKNTTLAGSVLKFLGSTSNPEAYFSVESMRLVGNNVASSVGIQLVNVAYGRLFNTAIESFAIGVDATDVEQFGFHDSNIRFNGIGIRGNAAVSVTSPNSWTFVNTVVGNNSTYGVQLTNPNALTWLGGSVQYNGTIGGGSGQFGIKLIDAGNGGGYGTALFDGMIFEGNGGAGDFVSSQQAGSFKINATFNNVSFLRTDLTTVGYGTNQIAISGAGTNASYKIINSNFWGAGAYAANAGRPAIANTNTNARVEVDGLTAFWSATEAPSTSSLYTGYPGSRTGSIVFGGATSGNLALSGPATASGTLTLPAATDTLVGKATTDTLTNKTINVANNTFNFTPITASLGADVLLNNTANYFDGPSVAQGSTGTWWASGTVTVIDTVGVGTILCKLWDGTTVISASVVSTPAANFIGTLSLSGTLASPAANIRISCKDSSSTSGKILFNFTATSKDSTVTAIRIN